VVGTKPVFRLCKTELKTLGRTAQVHGEFRVKKATDMPVDMCVSQRSVC